MWTWLLKRLLLLIVTLFGIAVLSFLVVTLAPGDPAALKANAMGKGRATGISEFTTRKNRELFFLDRPRIFYTDWGAALETPARSNLNRALEALEFGDMSEGGGVDEQDEAPTAE